MGALDEKYRMAIDAMRREAWRQRMTFKEFVVRLASEAGILRFPLWNEEFDAELIASSEAARSRSRSAAAANREGGAA